MKRIGKICNYGLAMMLMMSASVNVLNVNAKEDKVKKDETVYVKIDGEGHKQEVIVSDLLQNVQGLKNVDDISNLQQIANVKGNESFAQDDQALQWQVDKQDICYQGTTDQQLPVALSITYELDGKKMDLQELKGKSGHLKVTYHYENSLANTKDYVPFVMVTSIMADEQHFSQLKIDNGNILSDGDRHIIVGFGIPSLSNELGIEGIDIPSEFNFEAQVKDFERLDSVTIATNSIFNELELDKIDTVDKLETAIAQLQDASQQLVVGSKTLADGLDTLNLKSNELIAGITKLAEGGNLLVDGSSSLKAGANNLHEGLQTANTKVKEELVPGLKSLHDGILSMEAQLKAEQALPALSKGVQMIDDAMNKGNQQQGVLSIKDGANALKNGSGALQQGISQASEATGKLAEGINGVAQATTAINAGLGQGQQAVSALDQSSEQLKALLQQMKDNSQQQVNVNLQDIALNNVHGDVSARVSANARGSASGSVQVAVDGNSLYGEVIASLNEALAHLDQEANPETVAAINQAITNLQQPKTMDTTVTLADAYISNATLEDVILNDIVINNAYGSIDNYTLTLSNPNTEQALTLAQGINDGLKQLNGSLGSLLQAASQVNVAMNGQQGDNAGIVNGMQQLQQSMATTLLPGATQLQQGSEVLAGGIELVAQGSASLNAAVNGENGLLPQVDKGLALLANGSQQLYQGVASEQGLASGMDKLTQGADSLAKGSSQLNDGANKLVNGIDSLQDGSNLLVAGAKQLDDGAKQLHQGMTSFDQEGINQLATSVNGQMDELINKANELLSASKAYNNFSGIHQDMDGEVRFIFINA
ncbi:MAG: hypothetical protein MR210_05390 [Erysipelotrichaceae bacterium]|nr:hypothetical protein [Erysipelotrichaceae bacterium]MDY5252408.1 hypothetical protein [Erysipelotrichaceae bacterium]